MPATDISLLTKEYIVEPSRGAETLRSKLSSQSLQTAIYTSISS